MDCENQYSHPAVKTLIEVQFQNGKLKEFAMNSIDAIEYSENNVTLTIDKVQTYTGRTEEATNDYLIIKRKRRNKCEIVPVKKAVLSHSALDGTKEIAVIPEDYGKQNSALQRMFGGKKQIRRLEQRERHKLDVSRVQECLEETVKVIRAEDVPEVKSEKVQFEESLSNILPPCNRDAKDLAHVYVLSKILPGEMKTVASRVAMEILDSKQYDFSDVPFGLHCWTLAQKSTKVSREDSLAAALVLISIIRLMKAKLSDLRKRSFVLSSSQNVHDFVLQTFCSTDKQISRSSSQRDKAICYICALGFLACSYSIPLDLLAQDIKTGLKKLSQLCRAVGGSPQSKGSHVYELRLPLPVLPSFSRKSK